MEQLPLWVQVLLGPLGTLGCFIIAMWTGSKGVWVWGREKDAADRERDAWKAEAHAERESARERERASGRMG